MWRIGGARPPLPDGPPACRDARLPRELLDRLPAEPRLVRGGGLPLRPRALAPGERCSISAAARAWTCSPPRRRLARGRVTGVDITPEQLAAADRLRRGKHVSFLRARIEELPFDDGSFDAVISNGVINLSADKRRVFAEAARVLRPGGRLAIADIVTDRQIAARTACRGRPLGRLHRRGEPSRFTWRTSRPRASSCRSSARTRTTASPGAGAAHSDRYGAHSVSLLALEPVPEPPPPKPRDPGGLEMTHSHRHAPQWRRHRADVRHARSDQGQPEFAKFQFRATNRWIDGAHNRSTIQGFYAAGARTRPAPTRSRSTPVSPPSCSASTRAPTLRSTCCMRSPPA